MSILIQQIAEQMLIPESQVETIARSAYHRYKVYEIPKRNGGKRTISQPARVVKRMQRIVVKDILSRFPIHSSATAYKTGSSILDNAKIHAQQHYLLKLDFKDFFPSIGKNDLQHLFKSTDLLQEYDSQDIELLCRILLWKKTKDASPCLAIGAPSSPALSNILMFNFDSLVDTFCCKEHVSYSRYADDLAFSMQDRGQRSTIDTRLNEIISSIPFPKLQVNDSKTFFGSRAVSLRVTGLTLSNDGRVTLGRKRKRLLRAMWNHHINGKLSDKKTKRMQGLISFAKSIEPEYIEKLIGNNSDEMSELTELSS